MKSNKHYSRVGFGFDSHLFSNSGRLKLGGVEFADMHALKGHSDGDALLHAVVDALLGAAGMGDIGEIFPDTNAKFKGMDSSLMIREALQRVRRAGYAVLHVDVTVVAERPKLTPRKLAMRHSLSRLLEIGISSVNIKAKTPEGLNLFKKSGGVAVWAVATIVPK